MKQRTLIALALAFASACAAAHEGHAAVGTHLHASDVFGLLLAFGIAGAGLLWWKGRR
ncbi:MAG: hypothetical protein U1E80_03210 [Piscinibacter sp.]